VESEISAMDINVTSVEEWLESLDLGAYWPAFEKSGYDDLETVEELTEHELKTDIEGIKPGHIKKLVKQIALLKSSQGSSRQSLSGDGSDQAMSPPAVRGARGDREKVMLGDK